MAEQGGQLAPAITRYLEARPLFVRDIALIRAYLRQWIDSDVWDQNPAAGPDEAAELAKLREKARAITDQRDIDEWIAAALAFGVDPL
jgi:hypothetical protein